MKNTICKLRLFVVAALVSLGFAACQDAAVEIDEVNLGKLLRPSNVTSAVVDSESIAVSWRAIGDLFLLEYTKDEAFAVDVASVEVPVAKYTVTGLDESTTYYFRIKAISEKKGVASSEYSAITSARTRLEPRIPNVKAVSEMSYTLDPWSIMCKITMTWGDESLEPESITSVRVTPKAGGDALLFDVTADEALAQKAVFSEGILTDVDYTFELLTGTKMRGTCTHQTVSGPTPALHASSQIDFTTTPVTAVAELKWDLYYIPESDLSEVFITLQGATTPEQEIVITLADVVAGGLKVSNLTPASTYVAELKAADGRVIVLVEFTTPVAPPEFILVRPGDDLSSIISDKGRTLDVVYLMPGEYTISDVSPLIERNLVLTSDDPLQTTVRMDVAFRGSGTFEKMIFSNIKFVCATYFLQISGSDYDIDLYRIENCIVDLNSGASGNSTLFSTAGTSSSVSKQNLNHYEVLNSVVFANGAQTQAVVYNAASGSIGAFGQLKIANSTFANSARGLISISSAFDYGFDIVVENSTLYNLCSAGATALIDVRLKGAENAARRFVTLRNSILWHGSSKGYKLLQFAGSVDNEYVPLSQITCSNFYRFSSQNPTFGNAAYNIESQMTSYDGLPSDLCLNPQANPTAAGASFKIKDQAVVAAQQAAGTTLGDQRWK